MTNLDDARRVLREGSPTEKATELRALAWAIDVPDDVMHLIAGLMDDPSPARMYAPFRYGEVRYIAAETYAKLQFDRGRIEPVILKSTTIPRRRENLDKIGNSAGVSSANMDSLAWFAALRERGLLETIDEVFDREYFQDD